MDWYTWFATYYVIPQAVPLILADLQPQITSLQNQITELQQAMSTADDKVAKLVADVDSATAALGTVTQAFTDLKTQLQAEVGLTPASMTALDAADAKITAAVAAALAAIDPAAPAPAPAPAPDAPPAAN